MNLARSCAKGCSRLPWRVLSVAHKETRHTVACWTSRKPSGNNATRQPSELSSTSGRADAAQCSTMGHENHMSISFGCDRCRPPTTPKLLKFARKWALKQSRCRNYVCQAAGGAWRGTRRRTNLAHAWPHRKTEATRRQVTSKRKNAPVGAHCASNSKCLPPGAVLPQVRTWS